MFKLDPYPCMVPRPVSRDSVLTRFWLGLATGKFCEVRKSQETWAGRIDQS